jgi:DNA-binding NarL/FixJ family response regulator
VSIGVLVVDDDAGFRSIAVRILSAAGFDVVGEADTYASGLASARELRPGGILVDARLPDGDGVALARALRELPWGPAVLLTSSDGDVAAQAAAAGLGGPVPFVPKVDLPNVPLARMLDGSQAG